MSKLKKFSVCFGVTVPVYGSMVVEARTAKEANEIALRHYGTGEKTDSEWESEIWNSSLTSLDTIWSDAEDFRLLAAREIE